MRRLVERRFRKDKSQNPCDGSEAVADIPMENPCSLNLYPPTAKHVPRTYVDRSTVELR